MEMFPRQKSNLDLCTNPIGVHVLCRVMLDLLQSWYLLASFSTTEHKKYFTLSLDLLSLSFW